jgi:hypothetical protein
VDDPQPQDGEEEADLRVGEHAEVAEGHRPRIHVRHLHVERHEEQRQGVVADVEARPRGPVLVGGGAHATPEQHDGVRDDDQAGDERQQDEEEGPEHSFRSPTRASSRR